MLFRSLLIACTAISMIGMPFKALAQESQVWGAIAAYVESNSDSCRVGDSAAWNYGSHDGAANAAMRLCLQKSDRCADAVVWQGRGVCGAVATSAWHDGDGAHCAYGSARGSYEGASRLALQGCEDNNGGGNCSIDEIRCNSDE